MSERHAGTRKDHGEASGHPQGRKRVSIVGFVPQRWDALGLLVTGLLLALLVLGGVAPGEPRVAQPTDAAGHAAAPHVLCDLNSPCAPDLSAAWTSLCELNTPCPPGDVPTIPADQSPAVYGDDEAR